MKEFEQVLKILPDNLKSMLNNLNDEVKSKLEEIRIRINSPLVLGLDLGELFVNERGTCSEPKKAYKSTHKDVQKVIRILSRNSLYAFQEELKEGFITIPGGHRVGIVGEVMAENGRILTQKNISGINFRISKEIIGAGKSIVPVIFNSKTGCIDNTLIISPPGAGKTTLLRDLTRILSNGENKISPCKISLVDERSEIAGSYQGVPQKQIGIRSDVLDSCPKAAGIMLVIRSMSPDIVVTDEIGKEEDVKAIKEALNAGVKILVSAHSDSINSSLLRSGFKDLFQKGGFEHVILLSRKKGAGTIESITTPADFLKKNKISIETIEVGK